MREREAYHCCCGGGGTTLYRHCLLVERSSERRNEPASQRHLSERVLPACASLPDTEPGDEIPSTLDAKKEIEGKNREEQ